ncbi:GNAT family N-acetyltransferase [Chengkuizengella axinellae]|uniref:GNAT family N-acetyltransferase n=1 Tax=Chengkuizengella axinellae TaxID=3064388 RepID=A0ABT9IZR2_9BACL|nr:GNAT family N-acetyltransferase [Chengkuizengella sp. 2205SS18-9]MDP5274866.1 GNAT family N-acetyltransferase [Chengkuizengella sp. 2205SS18-9]
MIRTFKKDDAEYIINSHYEIYNKEYQYDFTFKQFVKEKVEGIIYRSNSEKERIWIVEMDGKPKGSIGITKVNDEVAQLGLFLIEPSLRGTGLGGKLVQEAIHFCREAGYHSIMLWTSSKHVAAKHLYEKYGFILKETRVQNLSNQDLIEERWELELHQEYKHRRLLI